jgi:L-ribulose-5-phosphate 3-epimerase
MTSTRRTFLTGLGAAGAFAAASRAFGAPDGCPFRLSIINDEISDDFDHACSVAANGFGLQWIEIRGMWGKNIAQMSDADVDRAREILHKYKLRVTDIASPLFKVHWPGAPQSKAGLPQDQFHADFDFKRQDEVLSRCIELCKAFQTDRLRCFDFWRLENVAPYRDAINDKLRQAARESAKHNIILLLENEMDCNTGSGAEAAATLNQIQEPNFMLNWDPGNSATFPGDTPYPNDYDLLPKHRIGHCHCKDTIRKPGGGTEWAPVGGGIIDWVGQFRAFERDGYHYAVSLETHWRGAGTPEASSRVSMAGLKKCLAQAGANC